MSVDAQPHQRWPALYAMLTGLDDPAPGTTARESVRRDLRLGQVDVTAARAELAEFAAGGADEARCRWLLDDLATLYDPVADFGSYRRCVEWLRHELERLSR